MTTDPVVMGAALEQLLATKPDAIVAAINAEGLFVPAPPSLPTAGHLEAQARSALDLVAPVSRVAVIEAWERVKANGGSQATVELAAGVAAASGRSRAMATLHLFDLRARHGVYVSVLVASEAAPVELEGIARIEAPAPRVVRSKKNEMAVYIEVEPEITAMLGWDGDEMVGHRGLDFIHPDDHDLAIDSWMEVLAKPGGTCWARLRHRHRDGRWVWLQISNRNLLDDPDDPHIAGEMLDITDEVEAQEAVRASEQLLSRLASALPVGVLQFDAEQTVVYSNERCTEILGADADADAGAALWAAVLDHDRLATAVQAVLSGPDVDIDLELDRADGSGRRRCTLALRALSDASGSVTGAVGCLSDVTDASRMQAELEHRATFDELTGCTNRPATLARLEAELGVAGATTAVVFVDLDGFKAINDEHGHAVGDAVLGVVAKRLQAAVRADDVVGRIGGDEFLVVCPDIAGDDDAMALADRMAQRVGDPIEVDGQVLHVRASVGVTCGRHGADADHLVAQADAAMYTSKQAGAGRPVWWTVAA